MRASITRADSPEDAILFKGRRSWPALGAKVNSIRELPVSFSLLSMESSIVKFAFRKPNFLSSDLVFFARSAAELRRFLCSKSARLRSFL